MNIIERLFSALALQMSALAAISSVATAQVTTVADPEITKPKICSFDTIGDLLPPALGDRSPSQLSYLAQQGFIQNPDGSWVCYVNDSKDIRRYYTLFKIQQIDKKLVASTFLDGGHLIAGQDNRSLDLFMMLIENHTNVSSLTRQVIRSSLENFITQVRSGKILPSNRRYRFDYPNQGLLLYHPLEGKLKGTAITINLN
ncbi:hypothetical protein F7734_29725 [Scytonema sp. UIC 10036]|uniref:hypothetical protein n=1 Tax=Scytonema sp. UIC 10036 TaxID=2304196 RepID=UPI0012DA12F0|nr:hypothetical protein [Scytonema sp. UIC 10036]MUG96293.1 hypothetical protein [Scytonema sp. UIC 10036]